ncbi:MAG TPA: phosphonate ABC transporter ATP-binding protein [Planctomycetota bacterium]|nr:phosphonate ABC transporter ATP-binding protein [Planctomycetota bacterium]
MVSLEDACVSFPGGIAALKNVSLTAKPGEFTVILGRSGAGKSTLLRCCNYLQKLDQGRVLIDGKELLAEKQIRAHRRRTAMIFQLHHLISRKTALDNVLAGRLGHYGFLRSLLPFSQKDVELALRSLERVDILDKANTRVAKLSGGERQRVAVARGLVQQPQIILADEPVASLDPVTARSVLQILQDICRTDKTTTLITLHQVELAREFGERIIGMCEGEVVFDGPPAQLNDAAIKKIYPHGEHATSPETAEKRKLLMLACSGSEISAYVDD